MEEEPWKIFLIDSICMTVMKMAMARTIESVTNVVYATDSGGALIVSVHGADREMLKLRLLDAWALDILLAPVATVLRGSVEEMCNRSAFAAALLFYPRASRRHHVTLIAKLIIATIVRCAMALVCARCARNVAADGDL